MSSVEETKAPVINTRLDGSRLQYVQNQFSKLGLPEESINIFGSTFVDWFDKKLINRNGFTVLRDPLKEGEEKGIKSVVHTFMKLFDYKFYLGEGMTEEERKMVDSFFGYLHVGDPRYIYKLVEIDERYSSIPESNHQERSEVFRNIFYEKLEPYLLSANRPENCIVKGRLNGLEFKSVERGEGLDELLRDQHIHPFVRKLRDKVKAVFVLEEEEASPVPRYVDGVENTRDFKKLELTEKGRK